MLCIFFSDYMLRSWGRVVHLSKLVAVVGPFGRRQPYLYPAKDISVTVPAILTATHQSRYHLRHQKAEGCTKSRYAYDQSSLFHLITLDEDRDNSIDTCNAGIGTRGFWTWMSPPKPSGIFPKKGDSREDPLLVY